MFSLPIGKPGTPLTVAGKTLAFDVKERQEINPDEMKKSLDMIRAEMLPQRREQYFNAYIQEVEEAHGDGQADQDQRIRHDPDRTDCFIGNDGDTRHGEKFSVFPCLRYYLTASRSELNVRLGRIAFEASSGSGA